ncbi:hypothetical protein KIN20_023102 [Parelaphostrongylus tenuis]|uniref:Uncharacterized protein n=1 Tax=Parelaphostrongylus tenuis TaxID=148309 RepID=A0AAD5N8N8_PARTN|nr:hypothetical protein KIN20_023102 [Parelaphostrongylus tenuis]
MSSLTSTPLHIHAQNVTVSVIIAVDTIWNTITRILKYERESEPPVCFLTALFISEDDLFSRHQLMNELPTDAVQR